MDEMESLQSKSLADKERADRLAKGQREALEKDLMEKMTLAKKEVRVCGSTWSHSHTKKSCDIKGFQGRISQPTLVSR